MSSGESPLSTEFRTSSVGVAIAYLLSRGLSFVENLALAADVNWEWVVAVLRQPSRIDALVAATAICLWRGGSVGLSRALPAASILLATLAAVGWNARPEFRKQLETGQSLSEFRRRIPEDARVYWHASGTAANDEAQLVWFGLNRSPYLNSAQGAGLVFSRGASIEYARRVRLLSSMNPREYLGLPRETLESFTLADGPTADELSMACLEAPTLDYVVTGTPVQAEHIAIWEPPSGPVFQDLLGKQPLETLRSARFYLYGCDAFRGDELGRPR